LQNTIFIVQTHAAVLQQTNFNVLKRPNAFSKNKLSIKKTFYGHGKLLITAEYYVLAGAKALAVPCKQGQSLVFEENNSSLLSWQSFDFQGNCWFSGEFELDPLKEIGGTPTGVGTKLLQILQATRTLNPDFLRQGGQVQTHLEFDRKWGLGSSSTLISNLAEWAQINPFELLENTFGGSGYDLSCASAQGPIHFQRNGFSPKVTPVEFNPPFAQQLFFVYQNNKQNSGSEIDKTKHLAFKDKEKINALTEAITSCENQAKFNALLAEHEELVGHYLKRIPIQKQLFNDFKGQIKSLGAWGGDFMLVSGDKEADLYFKTKGYSIFYPFEALVLDSP